MLFCPRMAKINVDNQRVNFNNWNNENPFWALCVKIRPLVLNYPVCFASALCLLDLMSFFWVLSDHSDDKDESVAENSASTESEKPSSPFSLQNLFILTIAGLVFYFSDFVNVVMYEQRIYR